MLRRIVILAVVAAPTAEPRLWALDREERRLLETTLKEHATTTDGIQTFRCRAVQEFHTSRGRIQMDVQVWKSTDHYLAKQQSGGVSSTVWISGGKAMTVSSRPAADGTTRSTVLINADNGNTEMMVVWGKICLPMVYGPDKRLMRFRDLLEKQPDLVRHVRKVREGGVDLVVVECQDALRQFKLTFTSAANWMLRSAEFSSPDGKSRGEWDFDLKEVAPAIHFPQRIVARIYSDGALESQQTHTISDAAVNVPLSTDTFQLKLPPGAGVTDQIHGRLYKVKTDGTLEDPATGDPLPQAPLRVGDAAPSDLEPRSVTLHEPRSWTWWIIGGATGVLLVGAVGVIRRRRRRGES